MPASSLSLLHVLVVPGVLTASALQIEIRTDNVAVGRGISPTCVTAQTRGLRSCLAPFLLSSMCKHSALTTRLKG